MKIGYISDIHYEFNKDRHIICPDMDILIVVGDIHNSPTVAVAKLKGLQDRIGGLVFYIIGNHEYYGRHFPNALSEYREQCDKTDGVMLLEQNELVTGGIRFFGTTLWSDLSNPNDALAIQNSLNDFRVIRTDDRYTNLTPEDVTNEYGICSNWLAARLQRPFAGSTVVATHHSPSPITCAEQYKSSSIRHAFHSDMSNVILDYEPDIWIYGHDHVTAEHTLGNTRLISNQCGYPWENAGAFEVKVIEI